MRDGVPPARPQDNAVQPFRARRLLALLVVVYVVHMLDRQIISILLEPLKHEFHLKDRQLGLLSGLAYSGAAIVTGVPLGMLADRMSRKRLLLAALACWSLFTGLCGLAASYPLLLLSRMGVGAAEGGAPPACLSMIGDAFPPERRGRATALFYAAGGLGAIISFTLGAWIASAWGWRWAFLFAATPGVLLFVLLSVMLEEPARDQPPSGDGGDKASALAVLFGSPSLMLTILALSLASVGATSLGAWGASLLIRGHGLSLRSAGLVMALSAGVASPIGQLCGGWLGDRVAAHGAGRQLLMAAAGTAGGAACAAFGVLSGVLPLAIAGMLLGVGAILSCIGPSYSTLITLSPGRHRGTLLAVTTVVTNLAGSGGGPVLVGALSDAIGGGDSLGRALPLVMLLPAASALPFILVARRLARASRG